MTDSHVLTGAKCQSCGSQTRQRKHGKLLANQDTWQRFVEVETHRLRDTGAPRALAIVQGKVQADAKAKE